MATMIPDSVQEFTTEGERQTYRFIEKVAKPDNRSICWYLPDIQGREPDFLLFSETAGLIILEVKDWNLEQIKEATPHQFTIDIGSKAESRPSPYKQGRDYVSGMMDKIRADGRLVSKDPIYHGNPKLPIDCGVVFPNINKYEYVKMGFDRVIPVEKIFFWDDLHPSSDICMDPSGSCFKDALEQKFPPRFAFQLSGPEIDHLKQLIFPTIRIELPERDYEMPYEKRLCRFKGLDHHQETLVRKFESGHWIIHGPSGSGKTLILVHKAACLLQYNSRIKSILFVCYNITLVNYIRRLLSGKKVPFGKGGVQVKQFFELCGEIIGETIEQENQDSDYYELVAQEASEKVKMSELKFDAILVDEGQDFSDTMFNVLTGLLNPDTDNLTIALDENQNLYQKRLSWKDLGVRARGRVHRIDYVYRNTIEISRFADRFIDLAQKEGDDDTRQMSLFPDFFDFHGPKPVIKQLLDLDAVVAYTVDEIGRVAVEEGCPYSEIAVLYAMQRLDPADSALPDRLEDELAAMGILSKWASKNYQSKRAYDITTNSVTISTLHSAKGMDFSCVFLLGLDFLEPKGWTEDQINRLVYVGLTRARYRLFIPYIHKNPIISRLIQCGNNG